MDGIAPPSVNTHAFYIVRSPDPVKTCPSESHVARKEVQEGVAGTSGGELMTLPNPLTRVKENTPDLGGLFR